MNDDQRAALAARLNLLTEEEFLLLSGVTVNTASSWRRRGDGPDYVRLGNYFYYPIDNLIKFLAVKVHHQQNVAGAYL